MTYAIAPKERIRQLTDVEQRLPADIAATPVSDQSENVAAKIQEVVINVVEAIVIVVAVVYLVVGFRTAAVMAANIPVVVVASIGLVSMLGVQLEQISLAALIISLGLLVDNAVQVCDQARTNQLAGMDRWRAAVSGANTLAVPMLIGTLTTVAAFLPMLIALEGGGKEYVYSLPVTVSMTLGLSWILAMSLCVILAGTFIRVEETKSDSPAPPASTHESEPDVTPGATHAAISTSTWSRIFAWFHPTGRTPPTHGKPRDVQEPLFYRIYERLALAVLRAKWLTLTVTLLVCVAIVQLPVSSEFFPEAARDQFAVEIHLPTTATIEVTDGVAQRVEAALRTLSPVGPDEPRYGKADQRLRALRTMVGGGGSRWHLGWDPEPPKQNYAEILVRTSDGRYTAQFAERLRHVCVNGDAPLGIEPIAGARIVPLQLALGPPADPLLLRVMGTGFADAAVLRETCEALKKIVDRQPETWNVHDSWGVNGYQVAVDVNKDRATLAGVSNSQVAQTLNSYYSGLRLTTFREGDHQVPVYFRLQPDDRQSIRSLQEAFVEGNQAKIPLASVADFRLYWDLAKIQRRNMNRVIEVAARMEPGVTGNDVVDRVLGSDEYQALTRGLPPGFWIEPGGSYEESQDAAGQMITSFAISFLLIVLCLVFQYNGWSKPVVILATLPMAAVGAWLGLYVSHNSLGFMPQLGILALFGIVLNTAIIFIEFADLVIAERADAFGATGPVAGLSIAEFRQCLVDAGKQRMLPIFLTTATTVGGLIPLALSGGPLWEGLAWCMIVGLLVTTVLTLFVVPALYGVLVETFRIAPIPPKPPI